MSNIISEGIGANPRKEQEIKLEPKEKELLRQCLRAFRTECRMHLPMEQMIQGVDACADLERKLQKMGLV